MSKYLYKHFVTDIYCKTGWQTASGSQMCYKKFKGPKQFLDAERHCNTEGGHLARISSNAENELVGSLGGKESFWIGLWSGSKNKCHVDTSKWVWTDGAASTGFHRWGNAESGQPWNPPDCHWGKSQGQAVRFNFPYQKNHWEDSPMTLELPFICGLCV